LSCYALQEIGPSLIQPSERRQILTAGGATILQQSLSGFLPSAFGLTPGPKRTNEITSVVKGIRRRRLGMTDIEVSELGLGTQRWVSEDFNAPDEALCHALMDKAIKEYGINLIDTAEQYPIPSSREHPEGETERVIGKWLSKNKRDSIVISTKITGGLNINKRNIIRDCENSLKRLQTDYIDIYLCHWPARYSPQSNWGQSLEYVWEYGRRNQRVASDFVEVVEAFGELIQAGKIRGYGSCNDNAVGLMGMVSAAKELGINLPCVMQNDYSLINRRIEENGMSEASCLYDVGFMAYNVLAGGMLTGKYGLSSENDALPPPSVDDPDQKRAQITASKPRGRMDSRGWGLTLQRYRTPAARRAAQQYFALAEQYKLSSPTELALRFPASRDAVTTSLIGHTSIEQLDSSVQAFRTAAKSELPTQLKWDIDRVHLQNRLPLFALDDAGSDWYNEGLIGERIP